MPKTKSMALNRTQQPDFKAIEHVAVPAAKREQLSNGIPVYYLDAGTQDVVKVELIFEAGNASQSAPLVAMVANALISGGTDTYTAKEIAERFDYYGAYLNLGTNMDHASVALYTLNKFLEPTLELLAHIVQHASYPAQEVETHLANARQEFVVNQEKVSILSRRNFRNALYGNDHPYGALATLADFDAIASDQLQQFKADRYVPQHCTMLVAGKVPQQLPDLLEGYFGNSWQADGSAQPMPQLNFSPSPGVRFVEKEGAIQSAIRIGCRFVPRSHPHFMPMQLLNAVLGGYFGSRLMSNIREDKGYTYGIGSAIVAWQQSSHFFIATEVGSEVTQAALTEIYREMDELCSTPIGEEELQLVKNYVLGNLLKSLDGPFSVADRLKPLLLLGEDESYYTRFVQSIHTTTAAQLQELANTYLRKERMIELVAGNKNAVSSL